MADIGEFDIAEEIISWSWRIIILVIVMSYINFYVLPSVVTVSDRNTEIIFDSIVSRARSCVEQGKELENCFKNYLIMSYGIKLNDKTLNSRLFESNEICKTKYVCREKEFSSEFGGKVKKYKLEARYHA